MCDVQELHRRVCEEREGKGDTGRLGRCKETQETAGDRRDMQGDAGRCRELSGKT